VLAFVIQLYVWRTACDDATLRWGVLDVLAATGSLAASGSGERAGREGDAIGAVWSGSGDGIAAPEVWDLPKAVNHS